LLNPLISFLKNPGFFLLSTLAMVNQY
jgi:hypothetical protein